jgi:F-type H+-transporting ATPase subunit gamma
MANARELRRRRISAQTTRKMTRTMELVAAARLKQMQLVAERFRPYAEGLHRLVHRLAQSVLLKAEAMGATESLPPLLSPRIPWRCVVLVVTSHRGLCGAFNANLVRRGITVIEEHLLMGRDVEVVSIGRKGAGLLRAQGITPDREYRDVMRAPTQADADAIIADYSGRLIDGSLDSVDVVYARIEGLTLARPANLRLMPAGGFSRRQLLRQAAEDSREYLHHPAADRLLSRLAPRVVRSDLYSCLLQTAVAANGARRVAMKNATAAADDLIKLLTRQCNRARQSRITAEIAEIVGTAGAMA